MQTEPTEDLLLMIGMHEADPDTEQQSKRAFEEFYRRFRDYVYKVSYQLCRSIDNRTQVAKDITSDTFLTLWQKANMFRPEDCDDVEKGVKVWLTGITKNTFLQYIHRAKKYTRESVVLENYHLYVEEPTPKGLNMDDLQSMEKTALHRALSELNEKERHILLTYYMFYDEDRFHVPVDERKRLCQLYGIADDTLRQIKGRAIKKIKKHIQENTDLLPTQLTATNG